MATIDPTDLRANLGSRQLAAGALAGGRFQDWSPVTAFLSEYSHYPVIYSQ
jgi:hypothetical protein